MPVEGAFDDEWEDEPSEEKVEEAPGPALSSAIPRAPEAGDADVDEDDAPTHLRLMVIAALAALIVVGGTALFITRPWDPDAYRTHAIEDADTSQAGFPGTVTHLEGQDTIESKERQAYLEDADEKVGTLMALMGEIGETCTTLEEPVEEYLSTGVLEEGTGRLSAIRDARERFNAAYDDVKVLDLRGSEYEDRQNAILVTAEYLQGRVETLCGVWEALEAVDQPSEALVAVKSAMATGKDGRSLEEWRSLFENSYASLEGQDE